MLLTVVELPKYLRASGKLRWARDGRGKSGGVLVFYYLHSNAMRLYLLTMFAKNERANLSRAERSAVAGLVDVLVRI